MISPVIASLVLAIAPAASPAATSADLSSGKASVIEQRVFELLNSQADEWFHEGMYECTTTICTMRQKYNPRDMEAYAIGAWLLWSAGYDDSARQTHLELAKANPDDYRAFYEVGLHWMGRRQPEKSALWFTHAVLRGAPVEVWKSLAHSYRQLGYYDQAIEVLRHAAELDPSDPTIPNNIVYFRELKMRSASPQSPPASSDLPPDQ